MPGCVLDKRRARRLGFPSREIYTYWLDGSMDIEYPETLKCSSHEIKNPEVPVLSNYEKGADGVFWSKFPKNELPTAACSRVDIEALKKRVEDVRDKMTSSEVRRADKVIRDLENGAGAY